MMRYGLRKAPDNDSQGTDELSVEVISADGRFLFYCSCQTAGQLLKDGKAMIDCDQGRNDPKKVPPKSQSVSVRTSDEKFALNCSPGTAGKLVRDQRAVVVKKRNKIDPFTIKLLPEFKIRQ
jgi:hypothetical protein